MDDLFSILVARAPQASQSAFIRIPTGPASEFQSSLANARAGETHPQRAMWALADDFVSGEPFGGESFVVDVAKLRLGAQLMRFHDRLRSLPDPTSLVDLAAAVVTEFDRDPEQVVELLDFTQDVGALEDTIVAVNLATQSRLTSLDDQVSSLRLLNLISRIASGDPALEMQGGIEAALSSPIVLPSTIFPVDKSMIQPLAVADYWVVRQHIARYELGEIAAVENILKGETRKQATKHTLSRSQTLILEEERTTETLQELQTNDRFDLKSEVESTLKEDLSVRAGVSVKYDSAPWTVAANVDVAYQQSKTDATKIATEEAREVVRRASTKVTERVRQQQTTVTTESLEQNDAHDFDNSQGPDNVTGVYQWINKIYLMQTFDLGPRTLYDLTIPEPAAMLWQLKDRPPANPLPEKPVPFTASPESLILTTIAPYLTMYRVTGIPEHPADHVTVARAYAGANDTDKFKSEVIPIPPGYRAVNAYVQTTQFSPNVTDPNDSNYPLLRVELGQKEFGFSHNTPGGKRYSLNDEELALPIAYSVNNIRNFAMSIDVRCELTREAEAKWQLAAHDAITQAYGQRLKEYEEQMAARAFQPAVTDPVRGINPDSNRKIERTELKRSAIALIAGPTIDLLSFDGLERDTPARPNPERAMREGRIGRFFEQAFEWENMNYIFYPYFWGRKEIWSDRVLVQDDDPLFADFLRAGQARVVVPVRKGFENDIEFFVRSGGQIWGGAPMPDVLRSDYLCIADEIRSAQDPVVGTPGDSWTVSLPTNQVYLRADSKLPCWKVDDRWRWTPDPDCELEQS